MDPTPKPIRRSFLMREAAAEAALTAMSLDRLDSAARVAVLAMESSADVHARAIALADQLGVVCVSHDDSVDPSVELIVAVTPQRLELRENISRRAHPVSVDFVGGDLDRRRRTAVAKHQLLARALGIRTGTSFVLDGTAGFLADAFHAACLGCRVVAIERSPLIAILAADGLQRGLSSGDAALIEILGRIRLIHGDARRVLGDRRELFSPDVVFLDPMYSGAERKALSRKELRLCRKLVGDDEDARELLETAKTVARKRVVVKRHPRARPLADPVSVQFSGRTVRYDVYLRRNEH